MSQTWKSSGSVPLIQERVIPISNFSTFETTNGNVEVSAFAGEFEALMKKAREDNDQFSGTEVCYKIMNGQTKTKLLLFAKSGWGVAIKKSC
jgi:hypothetical protein